MTPLERRQRERLERLADRLDGPTRRAYLRALRDVKDAADVQRAASLLKHGDVNGALYAILPPGAIGRFESDLATQSVRTLLAGFTSTMQHELPASMRVRIEGPAPAVLDAIDRLTANDVRPFIRDTREGVARVLRRGLTEGANPRDVARVAREYVGLAEYDVRIIESFEGQLRADPERALTRTLRDHRYDGTLRRLLRSGESLSETEIRAQVDAYAARLHAWRAETYSRTTTLNALREGQLTAWREAMEAAGIPPARMAKTWITTLDGRERPEHHDAHGTTVGIDDPFPVDGGVMTPGAHSFNCRCTQTFRVLPADPQARAAFLRERANRFAAERRVVRTTPEPSPTTRTTRGS